MYNKKMRGKMKLNFNCRDKLKPPLNGKRRTENIIHKGALFTEFNIKKVYLRLAEGKFKRNLYYSH